LGSSRCPGLLGSPRYLSDVFGIAIFIFEARNLVSKLALCLEPQLNQPPDGFGAGWFVKALCRPFIDTRPQLSRKPD
jgi:hypothetical protein